MTEPVISWQISADTQATMEVGNLVFKDVITTVHWRVTATDEATGESATVYGSKALSAPKDVDSYIDVSALRAMEPEQRKATVIGWAEAIDPGYLYEQDAKAREILASKLSAPAVSNIAII